MCFGRKAPPSQELQFTEHLEGRGEESGPNDTAQNCTGGGGGCWPQRVERLAKGTTVMRNFASVLNVDKRVEQVAKGTTVMRNFASVVNVDKLIERLAKGMIAMRGFFPVMNGDKRKGGG